MEWVECRDASVESAETLLLYTKCGPEEFLRRAVRREANLISYSCQWQLYHNLWMRGVAGVSCRKYARSKAPLKGELARRSRD